MRACAIVRTCNLYTISTNPDGRGLDPRYGIITGLDGTRSTGHAVQPDTYFSACIDARSTCTILYCVICTTSIVQAYVCLVWSERWCRCFLYGDVRVERFWTFWEDAGNPYNWLIALEGNSVPLIAYVSVLSDWWIFREHGRNFESSRVWQ